MWRSRTEGQDSFWYEFKDLQESAVQLASTSFSATLFRHPFSIPMPYDPFSWTPAQAKQLLRSLEEHGMSNWESVAADISGKTAAQAETHFKREYPQTPTGPPMGGQTDAQVCSVTGNIHLSHRGEGVVQASVALWRARVLVKRKRRDNEIFEVPWPNSFERRQNISGEPF